MADLKVRLTQNIKRKLLEDVNRIPIEMKMLLSEGEVISLFRNECEDISNCFLEFYYQLPKIVLSIAILSIMLCINPVFAIASLLPKMTMLVFIKGLTKQIISNRESARKSTSDLTEFISSFLGNIEYFKMIGNRDCIYEIFRKKCYKRSNNEIKDRVLDRVLHVFSENASNMTLGVVLLIAIPFFASGQFTVGEFVMFEYYYAFLASLPDAVGNIVKRSKQTKVSVERLYIVNEQYDQDYKGDVQYMNDQLKVSIESTELNIKIEAKRGQIILICDENEHFGEKLLQRMFIACEKSIREVNCKYVPKEPVLFDESIRDNICMDEIYQEEKLLTVLKKTDLQEDIKFFKDGIMKNVGKRGTAISGGQRKRIGIARALYTDAEILFIDGFTDQVDIQTEEKIIARVLDQFNGITFIISNSEKIANIADKIIRI